MSNPLEKQKLNCPKEEVWQGCLLTRLGSEGKEFRVLCNTVGKPFVERRPTEVDFPGELGKIPRNTG